jgi:membrane protein DedA with SNARE-associated domain
MSDYLNQINEYLDVAFTYGPFWVYLAIYIACFLENIVPPIPGDSFIVAAGGLVAAGRLELIPSMIAVIAGGMTSVMLIYFFARRFGRDYFMRKNFRLFSARDIMAVEERFARQGGILLVVSRFVVGMRVALIVAAGIGTYPASRMLFHCTLSYLLFASLLMYLGFTLIEHYERIEYYFRTYNYIVWPIVVALVAYFVFRRIRKISRNKDRKDAK